MAGKGLSKNLNDFVEKILWIWLPFVAFYLLLKEIMDKKKQN